ncbi:MAG: TolC family protein [Planctomycetaceae bacterium]|nr:TolC family protein [Planctomycetaceae bacterium]
MAVHHTTVLQKYAYFIALIMVVMTGQLGISPSVGDEKKVPPSPGTVSASDQTQSKEPGRGFTDPPNVPSPIGPTWGASSSDESASQSYSLEDLISLACKHNPTLLQARLHINSQLGRAMQAGLYPNPSLSYIGEQIGIDVPGNTDSPGEWQGAEIEQRIVTANKLKLSRNKYLQRAKIAEFLSVAQQYRVCNDVRVHFFKALAAADIIKLREELLKNARDDAVTTREMYNLGQATFAEVHQSNARLQQHRLALLNAQNNQRQHLLELMSLVGVRLSNPKLEGSLEEIREPIEFEEAAALLLAQSPELLAAKAKLREDSITVQRERVEWVPDLVLSAGSGYNYEARETTAAARVSIEVPLFDRNQGTITQAEADYARQRNEIRRTELHLQKMLAQTYSRYLTALQAVQNYRDVILPEKREAYRFHLKSYQQNRRNWSEVLKAYDDYTNSRVNYVHSQAEVRINEVLIDGFLLHGGLSTPGGPVPGGHIDSIPKPR